MKEFLQNIFIFISEKELILPFYIVIIMISSMKSISCFMQLGECYGGHPQQSRMNLIYFLINFLIFIESVVFLILNLLKIKEIMIFKISLIIYLVTIWYPYFKINKENHKRHKK